MSNSASNHSTPQNADINRNSSRDNSDSHSNMDNSATSADNEEYEWIPPRHIYALRDIIVENGGNNDALYDGQLFYDAREEDITSAPATDAAHVDVGDGSGELDVVDAMIVTSPRSESPPDDVTLSPPPTKGGESSTTTITKRTRMISSQMVNISKEDNIKLIKMSRGAVLCSQWIDDDTKEHEEDMRHYEEKEGEDESNGETASSYNNNNFHTAAAVVASSPQQVRICTTTNKDNMEEQVTVVPYSMARRRMGCNCRNNAEDEDEDETTANNRKVRALNAVCTICQSVKRSFFRHFKRDRTTTNSNSKLANEVDEEYCKECNYFGDNSNLTKPKKKSWLRRQRQQRRRRKRTRRNRSSLTARNAGMTIYGDEAVLGNTAAPSESSFFFSLFYARPFVSPQFIYILMHPPLSLPLHPTPTTTLVNDILTIDSSSGIYICETNLTTLKCQEIIHAAETLAQHKGAWSAYTYAKQTLGCKEYDDLAEACEDVVMTACATVRDRLEDMWAVSGGGGSDDNEKKEPVARDAGAVDEPGDDNTIEKKEEPIMEPKKALVLDTREPHVVKYDISRMERRKLDMHTDRSVWTFIIALSEGRGEDYAGGGTFFEKLNATVHLQRGQMIIFRGRQRHRGVKILYGRRYLLVGFLVEEKSGK